MAEARLEFIQLQLQAIQIQLREIRAATDLARCDIRSMYDNLAAGMTRGFAELEVRLGTGIGGLARLIDDRFDRLIEAIRNK